MFHIKSDFIGPLVSEEKMFESVDRLFKCKSLNEKVDFVVK